MPKKGTTSPSVIPSFTVSETTGGAARPLVVEDHGPSSLNKVKELFTNNHRDAALNMLNDLNEFSAEDAVILEELGHLLMGKQEFDAASTVHRKWTELEPDSGRAFNALAASFISANWVDLGYEAMSRAVALEPGKAIYQLNLAKLYMLREMWEQARIMLNNIMHTFPEEKQKVEILLEQIAQQEEGRG